MHLNQMHQRNQFRQRAKKRLTPVPDILHGSYTGGLGTWFARSTALVDIILYAIYIQ